MKISLLSLAIAYLACLAFTDAGWAPIREAKPYGRCGGHDCYHEEQKKPEKPMYHHQPSYEPDCGESCRPKPHCGDYCGHKPEPHHHHPRARIYNVNTNKNLNKQKASADVWSNIWDSLFSDQFASQSQEQSQKPHHCGPGIWSPHHTCH